MYPSIVLFFNNINLLLITTFFFNNYDFNNTFKNHILVYLIQFKMSVFIDQVM